MFDEKKRDLIIKQGEKGNLLQLQKDNVIITENIKLSNINWQVKILQYKIISTSPAGQVEFTKFEPCFQVCWHHTIAWWFDQSGK